MILPTSITTELAEETGWHIGDGSMNFYDNGGSVRGIYQLRGHMEDDRSHYIERIKPIFKRLYNIDISLREMPSTRVFGFQIWDSNLVNFKKKLGLPLGKKFTVDIPKAFLEDEELLKAVIRGIFDTDGGTYLWKRYGKLYPRMSIATISYPLSKQLVSGLIKLGIRATCYPEFRPHLPNSQTAYYVMIRGEEMFHKFMKEINPQNQKHQNKYKKFLDSKKAYK